MNNIIDMLAFEVSIYVEYYYHLAKIVSYLLWTTVLANPLVTIGSVLVTATVGYFLYQRVRN